MEDIKRKGVSCSGNAWKGFTCDQSLFPHIVEEWANLGDIASLVVIIIALIFCLLFWIASLRMNRDLTKSFMMPVAAPVTLLLPIELVHSLSLGFEKSESKEFFYTLEESERYLQNVFHLTLLLSLAAYLLHQTASARRGPTQGVEEDLNYSFSSLYVLILFFYTICCACILPVFPKDVIDFANVIIFGSYIMAYIAVTVLFLGAILIFCICTRPNSPEAVYPGFPVYAGYSRLGGALLFTQIVAIGPLIRGVLLLPLDQSLAAFLTNIYILLRFLLPLVLFLSTCLLLPAYREGFGGICTPGLCTEDYVPNVPQVVSVQYGSSLIPRSFHNLERRDAPASQYQARVENVEV